ncbi:hypothetical protein VTN77DRAFT_5532 [Rasamsonia byssochlamydoides]|uniref:uncharacterized protein n=1 Tax=Rasamsonia byssochlamydoides TaxID=89139 RepID=UPI0037432037
MFLAAHHPSLIDYDGPKPEGFKKPQLPENIQELNPQGKKAAKALFHAQSLWVFYETQVQKEAPDLLHAFLYKGTLPCQLLGLIGSTFDDGEPHIQKLLADIASEDVWKTLVGTDDRGQPKIPCPLAYSPDELEKQEREYAKWERDIERKAQILNESEYIQGGTELLHQTSMTKWLGDSKSPRKDSWIVKRERPRKEHNGKRHGRSKMNDELERPSQTAKYRTRCCTSGMWQ